MSKLKSGLIFYCAILIFSVVFQSCCTDKYKITGSGELAAYSADGDYTLIDSIVGAFYLESRHSTQIVSAENFSLISSAMATTCDYDFVNSVLLNEMTISCDQDFMYDGEVIAANSNFLDINELIVDDTGFRGSSTITIHFQDLFIEKAGFENKAYTFTVKSKTDDGLDLENEITLMMSL